ncbi:serine protease [Microlunatus sp. Gsoil 973]|uniref:trypsin-like serine peptidase n=1 Tax=Microlunatus sp. Gsoil 973 TaxID=2672569 RepID=UPI0012B440A5|nr:Ig-like domain-containing protein [Microlunatus sp. Gsoil 973]QGN34159.1 hypothetical protein GJV80_16550 [Microlunatus sp. Gsoil 973]
MKQRWTAVALAGSLMTVALGLSATPAAHAEQPKPVTVSADAQARAIAYWTPERMRQAKNVSVTRAAGQHTTAGPVEVGRQRVIRATSASSQSAETSRTKLGGRWTKGGKVVRTTGKVFFTIPRGEPGAHNYVCSGAVAPANNKSIIITAGHCVNDANEHADAGDGRPGKYVTNFVFVPGYNGARSGRAQTPYGKYAATSLLAGPRWIRGADFNYDVGFATVGGQFGGPDTGALVGNAQGSQGLGFNLPRHRYVENFGYPATKPYNGNVLDYSAGPALNADANGSRKGNSAKKDDPLGSNDQVVRSNLTGGSSGGPWFYNFKEATGTGTQISVNSFSYSELTKTQRRVYKIPKYNMWGPYFGSAIEKMFDSVQGRAPKATPKTATTPEDTATAITLTGTKSIAADPRPLTYKITSQPEHGKLTRTGNIVRYTPTKNFNGSDKFSYVANNGVNNSAPATVTVKVTPVEDAPKAADVAGHTRAGKPLDLTLQGTDPDKGDKLSYAVASAPTDGGTVTIKGDTADYTPAAGSGAQSTEKVTFSYTVSDGQRTSRPAIVTVTVAPNSAPFGRNDSYTVDAGRTLVVDAPGVLANDTDADKDLLSATLVGHAPHGLTFRSDGGFRYVAPLVYTDRTVSFTYRATDGLRDEAPVAAHLTRNAPARVPLTHSEDVTVTISVAAAHRPHQAQPPVATGPKPSRPDTPLPTSPASAGPSTSGEPPSQVPNGPLGDTGSPFSPAVIGIGLLTVAAGAGTLIAAARRRS